MIAVAKLSGKRLCLPQQKARLRCEKHGHLGGKLFGVSNG
jgi:hypothetical protein